METLVSELRTKNFPGVRMFQRWQVWGAGVLLDKDKAYNDELRARGFVMTRDDLQAAVAEVRKHVKTKLKKKINTVDTNLDNVQSGVKEVQSEIQDVIKTVDTKLYGFRSEIKDVSNTVDTKLDGFQTKIADMKTNVAAILAAIAASQPRNKKFQTIVNAIYR